MVQQFAELWPERRWLVERLKRAKSGRYAFFHDGKYSSAEGEVFAELEATFSRFGKTPFKQLIGFEKSSRRYLCPICLYNSEMRNAGFDFSTCHAAFLLPNHTTIQCSMCAAEFEITRSRCAEAECKSDVTYEPDDDAPMCLTCGNYFE